MLAYLLWLLLVVYCFISTDDDEADPQAEADVRRVQEDGEVHRQLDDRQIHRLQWNWEGRFRSSVQGHERLEQEDGGHQGARPGGRLAGPQWESTLDP